MILGALANLYDRLASDPDTEMAPVGWSVQGISFVVEITPQGDFIQLADIREMTKNGKPFAKRLVVPGTAKSSGPGINPNFLWDNYTYLLGFEKDIENPNPERSEASFKAFRQRLLSVEKDINDIEFSAVCRFIEKWSPNEKKALHQDIIEKGLINGAFRVQGSTHYVHECPMAQEYWNKLNCVSESISSQCSISGVNASIARLHKPTIQGVANANPMGAMLVSFQLESSKSYGKEQSFNAPVSEEIAFKYCTALVHLLKNHSQRMRIGDSTLVYWTEKPSACEMLFGQILDSSGVPEDADLKQKLAHILEALTQGRHPPELGEENTPFYILGLSPNAARLSVRFWQVSTIGETVRRLGQHFQDMAIIPPYNNHDEFPPFWKILAQTARESKEISPLLSGALLRAALGGTPYPQSLYSAILRRIHADREINMIRAGILKATILRQHRFSTTPFKEITMSLDPSRTEPGYKLGRAFAVLEKVQEDALPGIKATIKDKFFASASSTPANVFPRLMRLSQHHLAKLDNPGRRVYYEKIQQEIHNDLTRYPSHLGMEDQGLFVIGYYHQRQSFFTKKPEITLELQEGHAL